MVSRLLAKKLVIICILFKTKEFKFKLNSKTSNLFPKTIFQILTEEEDDPYDFSAQWTMSTASSVLTLCFLIEVIMKMIAFTPYGKILLHIRYKY